MEGRKRGRPRGSQRSMVRTTVALERDTYNLLMRFCEQRDMSQSKVIREAVKRYIRLEHLADNRADRKRRGAEYKEVAIPVEGSERTDKNDGEL